jgi:hypothetical protein
MDPTACLRSILELSAKLHHGRFHPTLTESERLDLGGELLEHIRNLQDWLRRGGFPPEVANVRSEDVDGCYYTVAKFFAV